MNYLVLLRHGQSEWNKENKFTGFTDVALSEKGVEEAKSSGVKLGHIKFDHVFTSTLKRAYHTAELALDNSCSNEHLRKGQEFLMTKHDDLRERDYGDLAGLNKDETREKYGEEQVHIWRRSFEIQPPGGESLKDVVARVKPYFEIHIKPMIAAGKNVLVAAHGNTLRAMMIILEEYNSDTINQCEIPTGVPVVFEFDQGKKGMYYFLEDNVSLTEKG